MTIARLKDILNLLSKVTPRRAWNAAKIIGSYYLSKWNKKPTHWGLPVSLSFEPTTACNLRCPECPSGLRSFTRPTGSLKADFFRNTIDQISKEGILLIFYFQGEPYLNPDFLKMVNYAHRKKLYTMTSTNAHFLTDEHAKKTVESGLDRLIISIDGTTQETYQQYRMGGQLEKVIQGAKNIIRWKNKLRSAKPYTIFQFLVVRPNEDQVEEVFQLAKELGIDEVKLKTAQIYDYQNGHPLIPRQEKYSRYIKKENGKYQLKYELQNHCWKMWHAAVITWDGKVVPCCFDKDAQFQMGNLHDDNFKKIWKGSAYHSFRERLFKSRKEINICTNCTEGCKVWVE